MNPLLNKEILANTTCINIQDVADFYYFGSDKEVFWHKDFITCVPPWNFTSVDWRMPDHSYSKDCGLTINKGDRLDINHFIINMRIKDNKKIPFDYMKYVNPTSTMPFENSLGLLKENSDGYKLGWVISIQTNINNLRISNREYFLKKDGKILLLDNENNKFFSPAIVMCKEKTQENAESFAQETLELEKVCLLALNFLNCKNVKINENPISRQVKRQHERKGEPVYKTYTLEIKAMREILKHSINENKTDIKKALHLCRGHFKTYTKENPLLGKFTGTYWWDMHARGDSTYGKVDKDYKIIK